MFGVSLLWKRWPLTLFWGNGSGYQSQLSFSYLRGAQNAKLKRNPTSIVQNRENHWWKLEVSSSIFLVQMMVFHDPSERGPVKPLGPVFAIGRPPHRPPQPPWKCLVGSWRHGADCWIWYLESCMKTILKLLKHPTKITGFRQGMQKQEICTKGVFFVRWGQFSFRSISCIQRSKHVFFSKNMTFQMTGFLSASMNGACQTWLIAGGEPVSQHPGGALRGGAGVLIRYRLRLGETVYTEETRNRTFHCCQLKTVCFFLYPIQTFRIEFLLAKAKILANCPRCIMLGE